MEGSDYNKLLTNNLTETVINLIFQFYNIFFKVCEKVIRDKFGADLAKAEKERKAMKDWETL